MSGIIGVRRQSGVVISLMRNFFERYKLEFPELHQLKMQTTTGRRRWMKETQTEKDVMLGGFLFKSRRNDGSTEKLPKCDRYKSEVARASLEDLKGRVILDVCAIPQIEIASSYTTFSGFTMAAQVDEEEMELDNKEGAHESRYNVPNRECSREEKCQNESRIPPNAEFMGLIKPSINGRDYCMECFAAEERRIQKTLYMKKRNENDKFEEVLRCLRCQKLWHRCCSFYLGNSNGFKCEECMEKAEMEKVYKVLDAGKGQSRIVRMMEDKLNAIPEEQQGRISIRSVAGDLL
ncbi:unnamed protein product [Caenorhabditis nigoni]